MQSYATMQRKKADLSKQVAQKVFDVSMDAQEGALYSVLDEMSDQVVKEQLLAYFLLLKHKYPVTEVRCWALLTLTATWPCSWAALAKALQRSFWLSITLLAQWPCMPVAMGCHARRVWPWCASAGPQGCSERHCNCGVFADFAVVRSQASAS